MKNSVAIGRGDRLLFYVQRPGGSVMWLVEPWGWVSGETWFSLCLYQAEAVLHHLVTLAVIYGPVREVSAIRGDNFYCFVARCGKQDLVRWGWWRRNVLWRLARAWARVLNWANYGKGWLAIDMRSGRAK